MDVCLQFNALLQRTGSYQERVENWCVIWLFWIPSDWTHVLSALSMNSAWQRQMVRTDEVEIRVSLPQRFTYIVSHTCWSLEHGVTDSERSGWGIKKGTVLFPFSLPEDFHHTTTPLSKIIIRKVSQTGECETYFPFGYLISSSAVDHYKGTDLYLLH